jgi:hypothetical protein
VIAQKKKNSEEKGRIGASKKKGLDGKAPNHMLRDFGWKRFAKELLPLWVRTLKTNQVHEGIWPPTPHGRKAMVSPLLRKRDDLLKGE